MGNYFGRTWPTSKTKGYCAYCGFHEEDEHDQQKCSEGLELAIRERLDALAEQSTGGETS